MKTEFISRPLKLILCSVIALSLIGLSADLGHARATARPKAHKAPAKDSPTYDAPTPAPPPSVDAKEGGEAAQESVDPADAVPAVPAEQPAPPLPSATPGAPSLPVVQTPQGLPAQAPRQAPPPVPVPRQEVIRPAVAGDKAAQARQDGGTVVLNFSEASLKDILKLVSDISGKNFIIAPGVNAKISMQTTKPVPKKDVFGIFETILDLNGLAAVNADPYYLIVQSASAKQRSLDVLSDTKDLPPGDRLVNLIIPIEFISANDLVQILKPMGSPSGNIVNYQKTNTLIITDTGANLKKFVEVIKALDADVFKRMGFEVVKLTNVDVKSFNKELTDVLGAVGLGRDAAQLSVIPVERLNSLILFSQSQRVIDVAKEWIARLDKTSTSEGHLINIYYVQNDKASTIKTVLEQIFGSSRKGGPQTAPGAPGAPAAQPGSPIVTISPALAQAASQLQSGGAAGGGLAAGGAEDVKIFLYEPSNALIIYATRRDYNSILTTIKELDRPPKQVMIDAFIAEVKLDESTKYGVQWSGITGNFNIQQNTGMFSTTIADPTKIISTPIGVTAPTGLSVFATDSSKFFAAIQAMASTGKVNVLSNPHVVVKNYEKASINIGSDEPVATQSTQTAVTGTSGLIQNIEYRKTGIILTVTPSITEGGMVSMSIRQEVSDKSTDRTVGSAVYPSFTKREAETSVVAKDRETIVIGGLIQEKRDRSYSGIPLLSSIPVLGNLFRYTSNVEGKTELIILLTPTVINNPEQAATVSDELKAKLSGLRDMLMEKDLGVGRPSLPAE